MGNLSNSRATGTPMVVTVGQQDRRHLLAEPFVLIAGSLPLWSGGDRHIPGDQPGCICSALHCGHESRMSRCSVTIAETRSAGVMSKA